MTTLIQSVTSNAIPHDRADEMYRRIGSTRTRLMDEVKTSFDRFVEAESDMNFIHVKTVEETKQRLADLIAACQSYSDNLAWKL